MNANTTVQAHIAGNEKFREVLTALGAINPPWRDENPQEHLMWGIAILLDSLESA